MANPYFNATYYLANNPDLFAAGVTVATAWDHYVSYGAQEAYTAGGMTRAPNAWFDANYYLTNNTDLIASGVTPDSALDHFTTYGMYELRSPNSQIAAAPITDASLLAYVNANSDLAKAFNIEIPATVLTAEQQNQVVSQYYGYGFSENRPAEPTQFNPNPTPVGSTFSLTAGLDFADGSTSFMNGTIPSSFKFTTGNEVIEASNGTWDVPGALDILRDVSSSDNDTLNAVIAAAGNLGITPTLSNIENINIVLQNAGAAGTLNLLNVTGAKQVTIAGTATTAGVSNLGVAGVTVVDASGVTAGAVTIAPTTNVTAALTLKGGAGADVISGSAGDDVITGGAGNDTLNGGAGNNTIDGGAGNDTITGGNGDNVVTAGAGNDTVTLGNGANTVDLGAGTDTLTVGNGNNIITAAGTATVTAGSGNNEITSTGTGPLTATVGAGNNTITAGSGGSTLTITGNGTNTVNGGAGVDTLTLTGNGALTFNGGAGADVVTITTTATATAASTITGGAGADVITLGALGSGVDTLVFGATDSGATLATADQIRNFKTAGSDVLNFNLAAGDTTNYAEDAAGAYATYATALTAADAFFAGATGASAGVRYYVTDATNSDGAGNAGAIVFIDRNGDGVSDQSVILVGQSEAGLSFLDIVG